MSKICANCHQQIADEARFCNNCGAQQPMGGGQQSAYTQGPSQGQGYVYGQNQGNGQNQGYAQGPVNSQGQGQGQGGYAGNVPPAGSEAFSTADVERNKVIAALAYFIFFLPLIAAPDSRFGRFHANQGLLLLILSVVGHMALNILWFFRGFLSPLFSLFCLVLAIMGLVNTLNGKARELPLIGQFRLIN